MNQHDSQIEEFKYYPLIVVRNSAITLQWNVPKAWFVYINNGIGFKKKKSICLTTHNKSNTYILKAFGWRGIKRKEIYPIVLKIEKRTPKVQLIDLKVKGVKTNNINNLSIFKGVSFKKINNLNIRYKELAITPDNESMYNDLETMYACESTSELNEFKKSLLKKNTD